MRPADLVVPADTTYRQQRAADPGASAWVSANAGAGKTRVLTDRVIRLLLSGAPPPRILCLTFTKAAAAEMTIRVFETLGRWVTLGDRDLAAALEAMTGAAPRPGEIADARRLFARAVETPGGLKIETIHAFCERILHLVPFEADVPARFTVLDDAQTGELLAAARAQVLTQAATGDPDAPLAAALEVVTGYASGDILTALIDCAVADERVPSEPGGGQAVIAALRAELDLPDDLSPDDVKREMLDGGIPPSEWPAIAAELRRTGKANDAKRAGGLAAAAAPGRLDTRLAAYRSVFFKADGGPRADKDLVTKSVPETLCGLLRGERDRLVGLSDRLAAAETVERTHALFILAGAVRRAAESRKQRLGALDFADLIRRTLALLQRDSAAWVLYKLDRGIDHVLVDEAQDTNPDQWRILRLLTEEFTAGAGRPAAAPRTVFAVGDPKQSIYSFQGADPREFETSRRHWSVASVGAGLGFHEVSLDLSFRSAPAVLQAVDATFGIAAHFRGLSYDAAQSGTSHQSARPHAPGAVEIWPTILKEPGAVDPDAWKLPLDEPESRSPPVLVADRIAAAVRCWITTGDESKRVWRPGDILILVRSRGSAFFATIRALKAAGIPVAGADRFDLAEHIAVNDLVAAGSAALLPANDLVLAAALKSPLAGLTDDDLIRIAPDRGERESLWAALRRFAEAGDAAARRGCDALARWRDLAAAHGPFGFYAALLGPEGGRRRLIGRLGHEAADAIDTFLTYAHLAEAGAETPSLAGFLARFDSAEHTIKRDPEAGSDEIRVMTVHGAKGLEAPLVVVIDDCEVGGREPVLVPVPVAPHGATLPVWSPRKDADCSIVARAREAAKALRGEEHNRLLYVAMTRARDRLVIAPFSNRGEPDQAWCAMARRGLREAGRKPTHTTAPHGPAEIWQHGTGPERPPAEATAVPPSAEVPDWLFAVAEPEACPGRPVSPSGAAGHGRGGTWHPDEAAARAEARRRGLLVHAVIEEIGALSAADRPAAADKLLAARAPRLDRDTRAELATAALRVIDHPDLAALFGPGSRAEVPIAGEIEIAGEGRFVAGQVDRMAVTPAGVVVADFKTGAHRPGEPVPERYLAQLALYRALLARAFLGRPVRTLLVWTAGPDIVEPTSADLDRALHGALDGALDGPA